jgi:superfamily II DNA or RNA helicase
MEKTFILALAEHRVAGYVFYAYLAELQPKSESYLLVERITSDDIRKRPAEFTDEQRKLVKIIDEYSDTELVRAFSKKKITNQEFIAGLTPDMVHNQIRPYIERRLVRLAELLQNSQVPTFFKDSPKLVYCSEQITIEPQPAEAIFNFFLTSTEFKYYLTVSHKGREMKLTNQPGIVMVNEPCHLVLDNRWLSFNDIDGKKLSPFFKNEFVNIPKVKERDYLEKFVLQVIKKYKINCSGFRIENIESNPVACLSLEADLSYNPVLNLSFDYGNNQVFRAWQPLETSVNLIEDEKGFVFQKLERSPVYEQRIVDELLNLGLKNDKTAFFRIENTDNDMPEEMVGNYVNWLNQNNETLNTFNIRLQQGFFDKVYYLKSIELTTQVNKKEDWFDVYSVVRFGDFEIPFVRFRKHILTNRREYILPDGEVVILPKEWFSQYADLFFVGRAEGEHIYVRPMQMQSIVDVPGVTKGYISSILALHETEDTESALPEMQATLRPYQVEGFSWMLRLNHNFLGGCLADDMGLGKTLQTLALLKKVIGELQTKGLSPKEMPASLIILPASLVHNWYNEIQKFTPGLNVLKYIGVNRSFDVSVFNEYNIVLTTYGVVRNEHENLKQYEFLYLILDESQTIKNPESKAFQAVTELKSRFKLVLTGTPIENSLIDLWSQFEFINPGLLGDLTFFKYQFVNPIERDNDEKRQEQLKRIISPFIMRRTKGAVATDLPALTEQFRYCSMSDSQKTFYEEEKSKVRNEILSSIDEVGVEKSTMMMLNALMKLRQIANHPLMVDKSYQADSGKFDEVVESLENMYSEDHKVLIFSSFVKHLELFQQLFESRGWKYVMLTGETRNREEVVNTFQTESDCKFFLISLKAGGVGLNLTAADYVFLLDPWWNPASEMQAINRAHRIGQQNKVFVYRFISAETIEEKIIKLQERKAELADVFINSNNPFKEMTKERILELFE